VSGELLQAAPLAGRISAGFIEYNIVPATGSGQANYAFLQRVGTGVRIVTKAGRVISSRFGCHGRSFNNAPAAIEDSASGECSP
jgi:hypothetical protein